MDDRQMLGERRPAQMSDRTPPSMMDDRRPPMMGDRRPLLDQSGGMGHSPHSNPGQAPNLMNYDRGPGGDMYSRRDSGLPKPM